MDTWEIAKDRPGYRRKIVKHNNATIVLYRPILSDMERAKAEQKLVAGLERATGEYYRRTCRAV